MGETFISCVFVCGKQGNGRRGKNIRKCLVGPWALVGRALMGRALMGRALMGRALMGRALMGPPGPVRAGPLWAPRALTGPALVRGTMWHRRRPEIHHLSN